MYYTNLVSHQYKALYRYQHSSQALLFGQSWCSKNRRHFPSSVLHRNTMYCSSYKLSEIRIGDFTMQSITVSSLENATEAEFIHSQSVDRYTQTARYSSKGNVGNVSDIKQGNQSQNEGANTIQNSFNAVISVSSFNIFNTFISF